MQHPMLNTAIKAARNAGDIIARSVDRIDRLNIQTKKENDFVSEVDLKAEEEIINTIKKAYPDHSFLAEESGKKVGSEYEWIIDPLDGTTNFLYGIPHFAVSIALRVKGRLEVGVVYDPLSQELFTAARGNGAQLNGKRIRVSPRKNLDGALLGTGIPYTKDQYEYMDNYFNMMKDLIPGTAGIRRAGSAALDLAYLAAGRFDGFWEFNLNIWDIAAGVLLIEEAGGMVGGLRGEPNFLDKGSIVAGNPKIFKAMLQKIKKHVPENL